MCGGLLQLVACDSPVGRLGLTVCYDLRFPEVYQKLAFDMGAQVLLVPSAFTKVTGMRSFFAWQRESRICALSPLSDNAGEETRFADFLNTLAC